MINLLPQHKKEELLLERNKKLIIVLACMVLVSLLCLALVLAFLKLTILSQVDYQQAILSASQRGYQLSENSSAGGLVKKYNAELATINNFYKKELYFTDSLKTILGVQRPAGVYFTDMQLSKSPKLQGLKVSVSGASDTRDDLVAFKNNLEGNRQITNVNFPPQSWIDPVHVTFTVTFQVATSK